MVLALDAGISTWQGLRIIRDVDEAILALQGDEEIACDLETSGLSPFRDKIAVLSMYGDTSDAMVVLHLRGAFPKRLKEFMSAPGRRWCYHNGPAFDIPFLMNVGVDFDRVKLFDTLVGETTLISNGRRQHSVSLRAAVERRLNITLDKNADHSSWMNPVLTDQQVRYCVEDISNLHALRRAQIEKAEETGQTRHLELEMAILSTVARMTYNGLPINLDALDAYLHQQRLDAQRVEGEIEQLVGRKVNLRSPMQLKALLAEVGIHVPSTARGVLEDTILDHDDPTGILGLVLRHRYADQRVKMYNTAWVAKHVTGGRIHARFWQCVAADSLIEMPRDLEQYPDGIPIQDVRAGQLVYSIDDAGALSLRRVLAIGPTGHKPVVRVTAVGSGGRGGKRGHTVSLRLTADHEVRLRDGSWKAAGDLQPGDRLACMPYRRLDEYPSFSLGNRHISEHRFVATQVAGGALPPGVVIHHEDGRPWNNSPENLTAKDGVADHMRGHFQIPREQIAAMLDGSAPVTCNPRTLRRRAFAEGLLDPQYPSERSDVLGMIRGETPLTMRPDSLRKRAIQFGLVPEDCVVDVGTGLLRKRKPQGPRRSNHVVTAVVPDGTADVWDMEIEGTHCFIAGGIAVHNCGTDTSRFSSSDPNLQQIPSRPPGGMRHVIEAEPGWAIVKCDYSQIEVRIAAHLARDEVMLGMFQAEGGADIHTMTAAAVWQLPPAAVSKNQRKIAKNMNFCLLFGGGWRTFHSYCRRNGSPLSESEAQLLVKQFFNAFPGLARTRSWAYDLANTNRSMVTLRLPTGLRRQLLGREQITPTRILNTTVQGTAACGLKYGLLECKRRGLDKYLGATVHDELVACVPEAWAGEYARQLQEAMIAGMAKVCAGLPVEAEAEFGATWA